MFENKTLAPEVPGDCHNNVAPEGAGKQTEEEKKMQPEGQQERKKSLSTAGPEEGAPGVRQNEADNNQTDEQSETKTDDPTEIRGKPRRRIATGVARKLASQS